MFNFLKFPQNIVLDYTTSQKIYSSRYWVFSYIIDEKSFFFLSNNFRVNNFFLKNKNFVKSTKHILSRKKFILYSSNKDLRDLKKLTPSKLSFYKKFFINRFKAKSRELHPKNSPKAVYAIFSSKSVFDKSLIFRMISNFSYNDSNNKINFFFSKNLFDIYFLKKEKIYTKLKYSRVPQYDIVSGGSAALLAGFLGFLICEKYGFELLDSGDFYFLFMYAVFIIFSLRFFVKFLDVNAPAWNFFSLKWLVVYYLNVIKLFLNFNFIFKKFL